MWLFYLITGTAVFFFVRFFILNSLLTPASRKATLTAALKAVYFAPLFLQGLFLLWMAIVHFFTNCKGFLVLFNFLAFKTENKDVYLFLYMLSYMLSTSLLLSLHFILGKLSLNKKFTPLHILFKAVYVTAAYFIINVMLLNADLAHPIAPPLTNIVVFNNPYVIIATVLSCILILLLSFLYKGRQYYFRYLQLGTFISSSYIVICMLTGVLLFLLHAVAKAID